MDVVLSGWIFLKLGFSGFFCFEGVKVLDVFWLCLDAGFCVDNVIFCFGCVLVFWFWCLESRAGIWNGGDLKL